MIVGNDIVPRISFGSVSKLRNDVLNAITRCKVNKTIILSSICRQLQEQDVLHDFAPPSEFRGAVETFNVSGGARAVMLLH